MEKPKYYVINFMEGEGDEIQLLEEMGFDKEKQICWNCKKYLLDYHLTCRYNSKRGKTTIYICLNCFARNTIKDLDYRMWHTKETIKKFIELRKKGITPYKIVSHGLLNIGMMTSFRWNKKFILKQNAKEITKDN